MSLQTKIKFSFTINKARDNIPGFDGRMSKHANKQHLLSFSSRDNSALPVNVIACSETFNGDTVNQE